MKVQPKMNGLKARFFGASRVTSRLKMRHRLVNVILCLVVPVEIIHATESSDGIANNVDHCWLFHSKVSEIQIILMFQQNIFLVAFLLLCLHVIYQIFFATFFGLKINSTDRKVPSSNPDGTKFL